MDGLTGLPAGRLAGLLRAREVSASEVVAAHLARLSQVNPSLNAVVQVAADVEDRARELDAALASGAEVGPLHGVPFTAKDNLASRGVVTAIGVVGSRRGVDLVKERPCAGQRCGTGRASHAGVHL